MRKGTRLKVAEVLGRQRFDPCKFGLYFVSVPFNKAVSEARKRVTFCRLDISSTFCKYGRPFLGMGESWGDYVSIECVDDKLYVVGRRLWLGKSAHLKGCDIYLPFYKAEDFLSAVCGKRRVDIAAFLCSKPHDRGAYVRQFRSRAAQCDRAPG